MSTHIVIHIEKKPIVEFESLADLERFLATDPKESLSDEEKRKSWQDAVALHTKSAKPLSKKEIAKIGVAAMERAKKKFLQGVTLEILRAPFPHIEGTSIPPDGVPCGRHPGCLSHQSKPCEGCGRIGGIRYTQEEINFLSFIHVRFPQSCGDLELPRFILNITRCQNLTAKQWKRKYDERVEHYHPEFGTFWQDDGEGGKLHKKIKDLEKLLAAAKAKILRLTKKDC